VSAAVVLGAVMGLMGATGLLILIAALLAPARPRPVRTPRAAALLVAAGYPRANPAALIAGSAGGALVTAILTLAITGLIVASAMAGLLAAVAPVLWLQRAARVRVERLRRAWPDAVDALASGIRAGLSLPEAVVSLASAGPADLRPVFSSAAAEYRATGSFDASLDHLGRDAQDGVADRVVVALRLGRDMGGTSIGDVLRTLSMVLREDARIRAEIRGRQSWTVSAARLAVMAPWLTLLLLSTRPGVVSAFATPAGAVVLVLAGALSATAYALMLRWGRLPELPRLTR
jgi:tight adherence protein B